MAPFCHNILPLHCPIGPHLDPLVGLKGTIIDGDLDGGLADGLSCGRDVWLNM